ncbi:pyridoxamine 5'-phosphate oxidase family protein [Rhodococcus aerolatus]
MTGTTHRRPGSDGEHRRQRERGTTARAEAFYDQQVLARLSPEMVDFLRRAELVVVATADAAGECDSSVRCGPPGFVVVLDESRLAYPEYRGNGVMASLGNLAENPHVGLLVLDLVDDVIGLHVNGSATVVEDEELRREHPALPADPVRGRRAECWVVVAVEEAYVHCRKHLPRYARADRRRSWGTDDPARKGGDHFAAAAQPRPWVG